MKELQGVNIEKFVKSFCGNDANLPDMQKPTCYDNGLVVATNGHIALVFKDDSWYEKHKDDCFAYHENDVKPEGINAIPIVQEPWVKYSNSITKLGSFKMSEQVFPVFDKKLRVGEFQHKYVDCKECDGSGELQCEHCDSYYDCNRCNGSGRLITRPDNLNGYYLYETYNHYFFLDDKLYIGVLVMDTLSDAMKMAGYDGIDVMFINVDGSKREAFFHIRDTDFYVFVMGRHDSDVLGDDDATIYPVSIK